MKKPQVVKKSLTTPASPQSQRGQGRKPLKEGVDSVIVPIRMTPVQKTKLKLLGGAQWVRDKIDKAKEPVSAPHPKEK